MSTFLIIIFVFLLIFIVLFGLAIASGRYLVRRREADPADSPANYGLAFEAVEFPSRYKATIRGWWIPASEPTMRTLIFVHGQNGSMDGDLPQAIPFHETGYNILMFNLRSHGTSEGKKITYGVFEKEDLLGAVDFLAQEKGIMSSAVMGLSMGTAVSVIAAALTDKIDTLILDGTYYRFYSAVHMGIRKRIPDPFAWLLAQLAVIGASIDTNTRMFQVSPLLWMKHLDPRIAVLFIHAENDDFVTLEQIEALEHDIRGPSKIWVAQDCDHRDAFKKYPTQYVETITDWLETHYETK